MFSVVDSKGAGSAAVVTINLSQPPFDHGTVAAGTCTNCHANDKPVGQIITSLECDVCHNTSAWLPPPTVFL